MKNKRLNTSLVMEQLRTARRKVDRAVEEAKRWADGQEDREWLLVDLESPIDPLKINCSSDWSGYLWREELYQALSELNKIEKLALRNKNNETHDHLLGAWSSMADKA